MLFGVSVRKMFAAFAIGADAETVPPSFLAFLSFRKKEANEPQLPETYSSASRPCQRAAQNGRFPYEPPVFSCSAAGAGGKRLAVKASPLGRSAFCFFSSGEKHPLTKQAAPHPLFRMRRAALCFVFYFPMLRYASS